MILYLGVSDLPIYNFDKILKTSNLLYLVVGWNEREVIKIPEKANELWSEIYNTYCELTENNEALAHYALLTELSYLESKYVIVHALITTLREHNKIEFGERLNKLNFQFDATKDIGSQAENLKRQLRIIEQEIRITKGKLEALKNEDDPKGILNQKIKLERITSLKINLKETSVEEWIAIHNEAQEIIEQQRKNG